MTEIAVNRCPRGTLLSDAGKAEYLKRKSLTEFDWTKLDRSDPILIAMMKEDMGKRIWGGECSDVKIITVPDDVTWTINSTRGREWVAAEVSHS